MKCKRFNVVLFFLAPLFSFAQITVDETLTVQELVEDVLINSACADVSNFSSLSGVDFGESASIGAFDGNGSDFPFESGIILSSGYIMNAPGPNLTTHSDGGFSWPGDTDLEAFTTATNTNNASWIQFDFVPYVNEISFNFIMASEEYNQNFECTYSDAFAFILTDQNTGISENLAVLPGTNIPIEVTNIRPEVPGQCSAVNEQYFDKYNFEPFNPAADAAIDFNGQIVQLTASSPVTPGNPYTIKLVVADETDTAFDMAVFLEANSFNIGNVDLGDDLTIANGNASCTNEVVTLDAGDISNATYTWFFNGVEITGETSSTLDVTEPGTYGVEVNIGGQCTAYDEVLVEFYPLPEIDLGEDYSTCDGQPYTLDATPSNPGELEDITYKWFQDGVEIPGETNSTFTVTVPGTYRVEVTGNGCTVSDEALIDLLAYSVDLGEDQVLCDLASFTIFPDLEGTTISNSTFLWSTGETTPSIVVSASGDYSVVVTSDGCEFEDSVTLTFSENPVIELGEDFETCFDVPVLLDASPSNYDPSEATYVWFLDDVLIEGATAPILEIFETGYYRVEVTVGVCFSEDTLLVSPREDLVVSLGDDFRSCPNEPQTLVAVTEETDVTYTWYLNGEVIVGETGSSLDILYPEDPLGALEYSVVITKGECTGSALVSILSYDVGVCVIPEGLSPNGDGLNDCLDLEFLADRSGSFSVEIFNRYGMSVFTQDPYINEFCGIDKDGNELTTGTYYYVIRFENADPQYGNLKTGWIYINKENN